MFRCSPRPAALLALLACLALPACERPAPEPAAPAEPAASDPKPAPEPPAPEEIHQGPGSLDPAQDPAQDPAGEAPPEGVAPGTPLATLPGFTPPAPRSAEDLPDPRTTPALPVTAATPDDAPVFFQLTVIDLTPAQPEALAPLADFLQGEQASALDQDETLALDELLAVLRADGTAQTIASPKVIVNAGQRAAVGITEVGPAGSRQQVSIELAPTLTPPQGDGPDAQRLVSVGYDFALSEAGSRWQVLAQDLRLDIGPRARVAGAGVVRSGETFFIVRRVAGEAEDRELLILIRPQVMPALNK